MFHRESKQYFIAMDKVMSTSMKAKGLNNPSWLNIFPIHNWFCSDKPLLPNEALLYSPVNIKEKLESLEKMFKSFPVQEQ